MNRTSAALPTIVLLAWLTLSPPAQAVAPPDGVDPLSARWVRELDDDEFAVREAAQRRLQQAGRRAIPTLATAATSESVEVSRRVFRILQQFLASKDEATAEATQRVLIKLVALSHPGASEKARSLLRAKLDEIVVRLQKAGVNVGIRDGKAVTVDLDRVKDLAPVLPLVRSLPDVEEVSANCNRVMDDDALGQLRGLPKLKTLDLYRTSIGNEGVKHLASFPGLRAVMMGETKVTDAGLKHLANLTHLEYVGVRGNKVTDAGLVHLAKLTNLTGLYLGETQVTDRGLKHLRGMKKMEYLRLHTVAVGDEGLKHLEGMSKLQQLDLWKTKATADGIERLREAIPKLRVVLVER